jgi:hypothetical protein
MESKFEDFVVIDGVVINLGSLFYLSVDAALFGVIRCVDRCLLCALLQLYLCDQMCGPLFVVCTAAVISV